MKKLMMILAITGILVSCSSKEETVKTEKTTEVTVTQEESKETDKVVAEVKPAEEEAKPEVTKEDYKKITGTDEPKESMETSEEVTSEPEKVETKTDATVDDAVDSDVDKEILEIEEKTKSVESEPVKEEGSNKTMYGIIGAILIALAAMFVFKKK
jgi:preprotein translocase subunit SecF